MPKIQKKLLLFIFSLCTFPFLSNLKAQTNLHCIKVENSKDLKEFLKFRATSRFPVIVAYRGGPQPGFPANCIATFENTLTMTPAMIHIDLQLTLDRKFVLLESKNLVKATNESGNIENLEWIELKGMKLKDIEGKITEYEITRFEDVLSWAKGKTILLVNPNTISPIYVFKMIKKMNAFNYTLIKVKNIRQIEEYYNLDSRFMFVCDIMDLKTLEEIDIKRIWKNILPCIGTDNSQKNILMVEEMNERGLKCMVTVKHITDLKSLENKGEMFYDLFSSGIEIIETLLPIEVSRQFDTTAKPAAGHKPVTKTRDKI